MDMFQPSLSQVALAAAGVGVVAHLAWFIHGDHMLYAPTYVLTALLAQPIATFLLVHFQGLPTLYSALLAFITYWCFLLGVFTSMIIYRVYFHPLRHFPGPPLAKYSQWYHFYKVKIERDCDNFRYLDRMHAKYGEYVRVGPNLLSVSDPDMVDPVHNPKTHYLKAECKLHKIWELG
jgi:cytochrome P450 family 628